MKEPKLPDTVQLYQHYLKNNKHYILLMSVKSWIQYYKDSPSNSLIPLNLINEYE